MNVKKKKKKEVEEEVEEEEKEVEEEFLDKISEDLLNINVIPNNLLWLHLSQ